MGLFFYHKQEIIHVLQVSIKSLAFLWKLSAVNN